jgi:hypothetical protein
MRHQAIANHRLGGAEERGGEGFVGDVGAEGSVFFSTMDENPDEFLELEETRFGVKVADELRFRGAGSRAIAAVVDLR